MPRLGELHHRCDLIAWVAASDSSRATFPATTGELRRMIIRYRFGIVFTKVPHSSCLPFRIERLFSSAIRLQDYALIVLGWHFGELHADWSE